MNADAQAFAESRAADPLAGTGVHATRPVHANLVAASLTALAVQRREGSLSEDGALMVRTGVHTGRSARDKFVVDEPDSTAEVDWGTVNQKLAPEQFALLAARVRAYLQGQELFTQDLYAGADPARRIRVRLVTTQAWCAQFARNMFIRPSEAELQGFSPDYVILHAPLFQADPAIDGVRSSTAIALSFAQRLIVIAGSEYAGEIKKSIFTVMNWLLPPAGVLPMHCSANIGPKGDVALFFGLSGTGKTTLSANPERQLIGDDEHGWSDTGVFNFEGGCYAKVIRLRPDTEPEIWGATRRFGTVLENVTLDAVTRGVEYDSDAITENTRACYPIHYIANHAPGGMGGIPKNIVLLTADAYGVMPPIARLTPEQAMYHFLSGYTAKVAGTERGVTEPSATFSACFGAPFLPLPPGVYARMLGERIARHGVRVWLVNTGWTGGPYGTGSR
ncbi:MAG TPA: phosphoenolpyruvate carboxykinase (ATP), partial [Acetobacteraceae bacterium]|nr:phosphoenolpyruvate carboxykinase (ATP) [Acetobacteraceae bacterium]